MEVLGAVASAITVYEVSAKGLSILREIPEVQGKFKDLCEEIQDINHILHELETTCHRTAGSTDVFDAFERIQLQRAAQRLGSIGEELKVVKDACQQSTFDNAVKAKKWKWILKRTNIDQLLQKARRVRSDIVEVRLTIMTRQNVDTVGMLKALVRSQPEMMGLLVSLQDRMATQSSTKEPPRIQELPDQLGDTNEDDELIVSKEKPTTIVKTHQKNMAPRRSKCPGLCQCRCHTKPLRLQTPQWTGNLIGDWQVRYLPFSRQAGGAWDPRCVCSLPESLRIEYRPPKWNLLSSFFSGQSFQLNFAMRPARVLSYENPVWTWIVKKDGALRETMQSGLVFYPGDCRDDGLEILEVALITENFDAVEVLLETWKNILPKQKLSRRIGLKATHVRRSRDVLGDREALLLDRVVSSVEDVVQPDDDFAKLDAAARSGQGMEEVLSHLQDKSIVDQMGDDGRSPLHSASLRGHVVAVYALLKAGADVHIRDAYGYTPLMLAAMRDNTAVMEILLQSKSRVGDRTYSGSPSLEIASSYGSLEAVRLLLRWGASPLACNTLGSGPLHEVGRHIKGQKPDAIEEIVHELVAAGPRSLEIQGQLQSTPLIVALSTDSLPFIRALIEAGAKLQTIGHGSWNLLHFVASYSSKETLLFLLSLEQSAFKGIDVRLRDSMGNTSWDLFVFSKHVDFWQSSFMRQEDSVDNSAFVQLYQCVRDCNFEQEITQLQGILRKLPHDVADASSRLSDLSRYSSGAGNEELAGWYRGVQHEVQSGEINSATTNLQDYIQELQDELKTPPQNRLSQRGECDSVTGWIGSEGEDDEDGWSKGGNSAIGEFGSDDGSEVDRDVEDEDGEDGLLVAS